MRCSCGFFSLPRQYAPATRVSAQPLPIMRVLGTCGPRQRSFQTVSPSRFDVVVDRELAGADLDGGALGGLLAAALEPDELELERLVDELGARLLVGDDPAHEALALADDALPSPCRWP